MYIQRTLVVAISITAVMFGMSKALAESCGVRSCLVAQPKQNGGFTLHLVSRTRQPMICYIRWENTIHIDRLFTRTKDVTLEPGYPVSGVRWRCDLTTECSNWMKNAGICNENANSGVN